MMLDTGLGGKAGVYAEVGLEHRQAYLLTHLLLFGRMGLHMLAEGAGVRVALGAARDLTGIWLLQHQRGRGGVSEGPPVRPKVLL